MDEGSENTPENLGGLNLQRASYVYGGMVVAGVVGAWLFLGKDPLFLPGDAWPPVWIRVALGLGLGALVVVLDKVVERFVPAFRAMGEAFMALLGRLEAGQVLGLALFSSVGEEIFFRGFLHSWVGLVASSVIFGLCHIAPDRRLWPWPFLATAMGFAFGWLFEYTGDVLAPVLAHFVINFVSLTLMRRRQRAS